jgi:hypothetical protein
MIPQVTQNLTIWRGITFDSFLVLCFQDTALTIPADITGWTAWAEVRPAPDDPNLIFNLSPFISNPTGGVVTIPAIQDEVTITLQEGKFKWDFTMQDPSGARRGPYIVGSCIIKDKVTQGQPPE